MSKKKKSAKKKEKPTIPDAAPLESEQEQVQEPVPAPVPDAHTAEDPGMLPAPDVAIPYDKDFTFEDFTQSVEALTAEELMAKKDTVPDGGQKAAPGKRSKAANFIQLALLFVFGSVLVVSLVMLGHNIWGKIEGGHIYDDVLEEFTPFIPGQTNASGAFPWNNTLTCFSGDAALQSLFDRINSGRGDGNKGGASGYDQQLEQMRASLTSLREINDDVFGWIYVEGTRINYPILLGSDNDYYLDHSYNNNYLPIGSIFLDYTTKSPITENYNTVIYGHNVAAGNMMFHDMTKFLNEDFFYSAKIYIYTMEGVYIYQPVSVYQTTAEYQYFRTEFGSEASFLEFAGEVLGNSKFPTDAALSAGDTMITLSTCTNGAANGRYALHAKLVETIS